MNRIEGYDLARALAIFGMVVVNFKIVMAGAGWGLESQAGPGWLYFLTGLFDGRAAAMFVVLAGVGMTLGARRALSSGVAAELRATRVLLWKRAAFLFVGGMFFSLLWEADILHFYGWYIGIGALLIGCRSRTLLWVAALLVIAFAGMVFTLDYEAGWDFDTLTYTDFWTVGGQARNLFFNGFHPVVPWLAFLVVGIWLGRQDMLNPSVRRRVLIVGACVALVTEVVSATLVELFTRNASSADEGIDRGAAGDRGDAADAPVHAGGGRDGAGGDLPVRGLLTTISRRAGSSCADRGGSIVADDLCRARDTGTGNSGRGWTSRGPELCGSRSRQRCRSTRFAVVFAVLWTRRWRRGPLEWAMRRVAGQ